MAQLPAWAPRIRSALYLPAHRQDYLAKADQRGADAIVLDLEDAVTSDRKVAARQNATAWIESRSDGMRPFAVVRINDVKQGMLEQDLDAIVRPGLLAVMAPKVETAGDVLEVAEAVSYYEGKRSLARGSVRIWPLVELATAVQNAADIARASARIAYMGGGSSQQGDLARSLGAEWTAEGMETLFARSKVLVDVRAAGVPNPISGLVSGIDAVDDLQLFARQARQLGYAGLMVIHPSHVAIVNEIFTPTASEMADARALLEALRQAEERGDGAVAYQGRMIDAAMARSMKDIISEAEG